MNSTNLFEKRNVNFHGIEQKYQTSMTFLIIIMIKLNLLVQAKLSARLLIANLGQLNMCITCQYVICGFNWDSSIAVLSVCQVSEIGDLSM